MPGTDHPAARKGASRSTRASGRTTLADVAKAAGVSPITVSRVLRGERRVDSELTAAVEKAVAAMGYVPDFAARALASKRGTQVVVMVPMLSNALFVEVLEAVHKALFPAGFQPMIGVTHYNPAEEEELLRSYLALRPAGLLLTGFDRTERSRQMIAASHVPCVHLMELTDAPDVYCVGFSQFDAGAAMAQHLLSRGKRRIACVASQLDPRTLQRVDGWRAGLAAAGVYDPRLEWMSRQPSSVALGGQLFNDLLATRKDVDAIFFCNDDLAHGALLEARKTGRRVPQDIAIAGFNDLAGSAEMIPSLTTVRTPRAGVGQHGAHMLLSLMRGTPPARRALALEFELVQRDST